MKNNRKGFMLVEIIIVASVIMIGLVSLFSITSNIFLQYEKRIAYDNVDATFVARGVAEKYEDLIKTEFKADDNKFINITSLNNDDYLKEYNVVRVYVVKYNPDDIRFFLEEVDKTNTEEDKMGLNFYDYIDRFITSNDFNDSIYVNSNLEEGKYQYVIFAATSDNCDENDVCVEDNSNITFGNYKFIYDELDISKDIYPPKIELVSIESKIVDGGYITSPDTNTEHTITWKGYDVEGASIKKYVVKLYDQSFDLTPFDDDFVFEETIYDPIPGKEYSFSFSKNDIENKIINSDTYNNIWTIKIYGIDERDNSGLINCFANDSSYCSIREEFIGIPKTYNTIGDYFDIAIEGTENGLKYKVSEDGSSNRVLTKMEFFDSNGEEIFESISFEKDKSIKSYEGTLDNISKWFRIHITSEDEGCLIEGTKVLLANGKYKNIEDIDYNDLLTVYDHELGEISYQYAGWIEKPGVSQGYTKVTFSDGNTLGFVNDHAVYSFDYNEYINISNKDKFRIGSRVAKVKNNKVETVYVTNIEYIEEMVNYYHILTNKDFNIITNDILTVNKEIFVSNFHGFNEDMTWKIPRLKDVYDYKEFTEIPYYMFEGFRLYEGKYFINYGMDKNKYIEFLKKFILNDSRTLVPKLNDSGVREWMVTTSDDIVTEENKLSFLKEEGTYYTLKEPKKQNNKLFLGWFHTGNNKIYKPGDKVDVLHGTHFVAQYRDLFDNFNGSDNFEKIK